jgi:hypothetical protein
VFIEAKRAYPHNLVLEPGPCCTICKSTQHMHGWCEMSSERDRENILCTELHPVWSPIESDTSAEDYSPQEAQCYICSTVLLLASAGSQKKATQSRNEPAIHPAPSSIPQGIHATRWLTTAAAAKSLPLKVGQVGFSNIPLQLLASIGS